MKNNIYSHFQNVKETRPAVLENPFTELFKLVSNIEDMRKCGMKELAQEETENLKVFLKDLAVYRSNQLNKENS